MKSPVRLGGVQAAAVLIGGWATVGAYNLVQWRRDHALALLSRKSRQAATQLPTPTPRVTILVAAWNEAPIIGRHVESVLRLRYPDLEYILCAGGTDGTYNLVRHYAGPGVLVLEQRPGEGKQASLRRCLEQATGQIIFFTDADCLLDDESFERTIAPLVRGEAEASTGGSRPLPEQLARNSLVAYRWSADLYATARAPIAAAGLLGRNAAVARDALDRAGGLHADVPAGTDYHLAKSLLATGARIRLVPESEVATRYAESLGDYGRRQRRWLRNVVLLGPRFGAYNEAASALLTSLVGLAMLLAPAVSRLIGPIGIVGWLLALTHGAASRVRYRAFTSLVSEGINQSVGPAELPRVVVVMLAEFMVWAWVVLDYLLPWRRRAW